MQRAMRAAMVAGHSAGADTARSAPRRGMSVVTSSHNRMANWKMSAASVHLHNRCSDHALGGPWKGFGIYDSMHAHPLPWLKHAFLCAIPDLGCPGIQL